MNGCIEILLFDIGLHYYGAVHESAREVCEQRGIPLRELDITKQMDLARQYQVLNFPQCILLRDGRIIGETHVIFHTPATFSTWLDDLLESDRSI